MNSYVASRWSLLLAFAIATPCLGQLGDPEPHLEAATQAAKDGQRDEAIKQLDQAVAAGQGQAGPLLNAGNLFATLGELPRAQEVLRQALVLDGPTKPQALLSLARVQAALNKPEEATQLLEQVLEMNPADVNAHLQLFNIESVTDSLDLSEARVQQFEIDKKIPAHIASYLRGSLYCLQEKWREATEALEAALPQLNEPTMQTVAHLRLSQAYEFLGEHDLRLSHLREVIKQNPENVQFKWFEVQALLALKRTEEAVLKYMDSETLFRETAKRVGNEQFLVQQAQMEILQQSTLPKAKRTYSDLEKLLYTIDESQRIPDNVKKQLRAMFYDKTGRVQEAEALRAEIRELNADDGLTTMVNQAREMAKQPNGLMATMQQLDAAKEQFGDLVELRLVRAAILTDIRPPAYIESIKSLANNVSEYSETEQFQLLSQLGTILVAEGQLEAAVELWNRAAEVGPDNLDLAMRLFEATLAMNDNEAIMKRGLALRELAGPRSAVWKWARASRIVSQVRRGELESDQLAEAKTLVTEAIAEREGWEQLYKLEGDIYALEGNETKAAQSYAKAIDLGSTNVTLHRALIRLYFTQGNLADAERILRRLPRTKWQIEEQKIAEAIKAQR